jgi:hypothetical protein
LDISANNTKEKKKNQYFQSGVISKEFNPCDDKIYERTSYDAMETLQTIDMNGHIRQSEQDSKELFSDPMGDLNIDFSTLRKKSKFFDKRVAFNTRNENHLNTSFDRQNSSKTMGDSTSIPIAIQSGGSNIFNFKVTKENGTVPKRTSSFMTLKQRESLLRGDIGNIFLKKFSPYFFSLFLASIMEKKGSFEWEMTAEQKDRARKNWAKLKMLYFKTTQFSNR